MAESGEQVVVYQRQDGPQPEVYLITNQRVLTQLCCKGLQSTEPTGGNPAHKVVSRRRTASPGGVVAVCPDRPLLHVVMPAETPHPGPGRGMWSSLASPRGAWCREIVAPLTSSTVLDSLHHLIHMQQNWSCPGPLPKLRSKIAHLSTDKTRGPITGRGSGVGFLLGTPAEIAPAGRYLDLGVG
jgi:hypothetical protein